MDDLHGESLLFINDDGCFYDFSASQDMAIQLVIYHSRIYGFGLPGWFAFFLAKNV